jgi:diguanylate cyclase (GGDEF)-like protein
MIIEPLDQELRQKLPSPQGVALAIMEACRREEVSLGEVSHLVQTDPALTGRLLKLANAAALGGRPLVSVPQAVSRMGLQAVRQLALGFSLIDQYAQGDCSGFNYPAFWSHSLLVGLAMREIGSHFRLASHDDLFSCGLLARVGCLALATAYPNEYTELLLKDATGPELLRLERQALQTDHLHLSGALLSEWGVPASLLEPVLAQEDPGQATFASGSRPWQLARVLQLALHTADLLMAPQVEPSERISGLRTLAHEVGLGDDDLGRCIDNVAREWRVWGEIFKVRANALAPFNDMLQAAVPPDQEADSRWLRVLIVEDDRIVRSLLETWLGTKCQHTVMTASNGKEGLARALEFKPQVVLTDWLMPVLDGLELCRALRASDWGKNIYVLMITSVESEGDLVRAFDAGVDDYLTKPVNLRALGARLKAAWRYVRMRDAWERDHERLTRTAAELALSNRRLQLAAMSDPLTELANRRAGLIALSQSWSAAIRYGKPLSIISIDVDHFKSVNDLQGHAAGDEVLQRVSQGLRATSRREDTVCRWGGEEFMVICPNMALREGLQAAERFRKAIADLSIVINGKLIQVTVSLGLASWDSATLSPEQLLSNADKALYAAKKGGRNRLSVYSDSPHGV